MLWSARTEATSTVRSVLRGSANDDVPGADKLPALRCRRIKFTDHREALLVGAHALENSVSVVLRDARNEELRREHTLAVPFHGDMPVDRSAGVEAGLYGTKAIFTLWVSHDLSVALKIWIAYSTLLNAPTVKVAAVHVSLLEFDHGVRDRLSIGVQKTAAQLGRDSPGRSCATQDLREVIVLIER